MIFNLSEGLRNWAAPQNPTLVRPSLNLLCDSSVNETVPFFSFAHHHPLELSITSATRLRRGAFRLGIAGCSVEVEWRE